MVNLNGKNKHSYKNTQPLAFDPKRQAHDALRGYRYQILCSVLAWLRLKDDETLYLELAEDIDLHQEETVTANQVKDLSKSGNLTLRRKEVIDLINNYWDTRERNATRKVSYNLLTTAKVGLEDKEPFGVGIKGIDLWNRCTLGDVAIIKKFLVEEGKVSGSLQNYLNKSTDEEILRELIVPVKIRTDEPSLEKIRHEIEREVIVYGVKVRCPADHSKKAVEALIDYVFDIVSRDKKPSIHISNFYDLFEQATGQFLSHAELEEYKHLASEVIRLQNRLLALTAPEQTGVLDSAHDPQLAEIKKLVDEFNSTLALQELEKIKDSVFSSGTENAKYRHLTFTAICKLRGDNYEEASTLFLKALPYSPNSANALANAAYGAYLANDFVTANKYIEQAKIANPKEPYVYSTLVGIAPKGQPFEQILADVPQEMMQTERVALALGFAALHRDKINEAVKFFERGHEINPNDIEVIGALGSALLEQLYQVKDSLVTGQVNTTLDKALKRIGDLLQKAWDSVRSTDLNQQRFSWAINLAQVRRQQNRHNDAKDLLNEALGLSPNDNDAHKLSAIVAYELDDLKGAIAHTKQVSEEKSPEKPLLLAQYHSSNNEPAEAIVSLKDAIANGRNNDVKIFAYCHLAQLLQKDGNLPEAKEVLENGQSEFPNSHLIKINVGKILLSNGEAEAALAIAEPLVPEVIKDASIVERIELADLCLDLGAHTIAAQVYESFVDTSIDTPFIRRLVGSYFEGNRSDKALELIEGVLKNNPRTAFYTEIEGAIYEDVPDLEKAQSIYDAYLEDHPSDIRIGIRRANLMLRLGKPEEVDKFLATCDPMSLPLEWMTHTANFYVARNKIERAIEILYEARRRFYDHARAHSSYCGLILMRDDIGNSLLRTDVVTEGTAVKLSDNVNRWIHIVSDKEQDTQHDKFGVSHELSRLLLGKSVNSVVPLKGIAGRSNVQILEIKTKYLFAFHQSMESFPELFPNDRTLIRVDLGSDDAPEELSARLKEAMEQINPKESDYLQGTLANYKKKQFPLYCLSKLLRKSDLETIYALIDSQGVGITSCIGRADERQAAHDLIISSEVLLLLDLTSVVTLAELGLLETVKKAYPNLYVCRTTIEAIKRLIAEKQHEAKNGRTTLAPTETGVALNTITAEAVQSFLAKLTATIEWLEANCTTAMPTLKLKAEGEKFNQLESLVGASAADSIISAASNNLILASDDMLLRQVANEIDNIKGVWSQIILIELLRRKLIAVSEYHAAVNWLLQAGYEHTTFNKYTIFWCVQNDDWQVTPALVRLFERLVAPNTDLLISLRIGIEFLIDLWESDLDFYTKRRISYALFNAVFAVPEKGWEALRAIWTLWRDSMIVRGINIDDVIHGWTTGHFMWTAKKASSDVGKKSGKQSKKQTKQAKKTRPR